MISEPIPQTLAERLAANREGRLLGTQWRDIVVEPLAPLFLLALPGALLLARIPPTLRLWTLLLALLIIAGMLVLRGRRYARLPLYCARLYGGEKKRWRGGLVLYQANGQPMTFRKYYAPLPPIKADAPYIAYYLLDHEQPLLLSIADAHLPQAQPSPQFHQRGGRLMGDV